MFEKLLNKPESHRKKVAFLTTSVLFLAIFFSWVSYKGLLSPNQELADSLRQSSQTAAVELSDQPAPAAERPAAKPVERSDSAWDILKKQFGLFRESVASVFVPFMTGIEVYDNGHKK